MKPGLRVNLMDVETLSILTEELGPRREISIAFTAQHQLVIGLGKQSCF